MQLTATLSLARRFLPTLRTRDRTAALDAAYCTATGKGYSAEQDDVITIFGLKGRGFAGGPFVLAVFVVVVVVVNDEVEVVVDVACSCLRARFVRRA